jgi:Glyceraldehyde 3-phosphate dehydrogenase, C-terminal domain
MVDEVNALFKAVADGPLNGILSYETRALVSSDYTNDPRFSIIDAQPTMEINGTQVKIYARYDNEWGYACRLADITRMVAGDPRVNRLSFARTFLFGARDVWFVVGVPAYFQIAQSDGTPDGRRRAFFVISEFLALWIILYGAAPPYHRGNGTTGGGKGEPVGGIPHADPFFRCRRRF